MSTAPTRPSPRILVVEDDFTNRCVLLEILKSMGSVHVAVNGEEAVAAFRAGLEAGTPYTIVCLDIFLPGVDGLEVLRTIRGLETARGIASTVGAKILMVTGSQDLKDVFRSYHGLCDGYLTKPIEKARLLEELKRVGVVPRTA